MLKTIIISLLILGLANLINATSFIEIPDSLKKGANTIILNYDLQIKVNSIKNVRVFEKKTIAILDKSGDENAVFIEYYDPAKKIRKLSAIRYDIFGNKIGDKLYKGDFEDYSATGYNLISDDRVKYFEPVINKYPYIIEYIIEYDYINGYFLLPSYFPVEDEKIALYKSKFQLTYPEIMDFRILPKNICINEIIKSVSDNIIKIECAVDNFKAYRYEPFSELNSAIFPNIKAIPNHFYMLGYQGKQDTWSNFGNWIYKLSEDISLLSESTKFELDSLKKISESELDLMERVYKYMQNKTRYVSIQLGIGGWKPMSCAEVDKLGYGDCKALVNYTKSLYDYLEIPSLYTLVRAGKGRKSIDIENPYNQFNHVILTLPNRGDTLWLECTSQIKPFGHIGSFTDDRDVLIIKKNDSYMTHTRKYDKTENIRISSNTITIRKSGFASFQNKIEYLGLQYDDVKYWVYKNNEDQKKEIYEEFDNLSFVIQSIKIEDNPGFMPKLKLNLNLNSNTFVSVSSSRFFIPICPIYPNVYIPREIKHRISDIVIRHDFNSIDTTIISNPMNCTIEYIAENKNITTDFGSYKLEVTKTDSTISFIRNFEFIKGTYPAVNYENFRDFFVQVSKIDREKMILKSN
jgi:hypothetical protein